jgi:hypothetical protein
MKTKLLYVAAVLTLISCKKELEPQESSVVDSTAVAAPAPSMQSALQVDPLATQPAQMQTQQAQTQQTAPGMNPPHGQPGHRCDIPVGQPLNSAPSNSGAQMVVNNTPSPGAAKTVMVPSPVATETQTAPGMNPPHGQPGHRCDIPVGQPLADAPKTSDVPALLSAPAEETKQ